MSEYVGRGPELALLDARLGRAASGTGGFVRVTGEPGIGKTALAQQIVGRARRLAFDVAWASCWQTAAVPPLWPWRQLLGQLAAAGDREPPDLADGPGAGARSVDGAELDVARAEQGERVATWLRGRDRPALLVLDDLQWADAATVAVLDHVAGTAPTLPLLVVATARAADDEPASAYAEAVRRPRRFGEELVLDGLGPHDSSVLLAGVAAGVAPDHRTAAAVHDLTDGNPLFVVEVGRDLAAAGPALPGTVVELVGRRLERLPPPSRSLLDALAVAGDEASLDLLAAVTELPVEATLAAVDDASAAGLVALEGASIRFAHALFRAAAYDLLAPSTRARWHDLVGRALLARRDAGAPVDAAALAHHFGASAPLGNAAVAFGFAREAAAEAGRLLSFDLAARRLEQALDLLGLEPSLGDRAPLLLELADALVAAGDGERARAAFAAAADDARRRGDAADLGRAALGCSGGVGGIEVVLGDRTVCALLAEAAAALEDDLVLGPQVEARLSVASTFLEPLEARAAVAARACERARKGGDPATVALAVAGWADCIAGPAHVGARRDAADEIVDAATATGALRTELLGRRLRLVALLEAGDLTAAEEETNRYETAAERVGRPEYSWYPALWRASIAFARGDELGYRRHRADLAAREAVGSTNAWLLALVHDLATAWDAGQLEGAPAIAEGIAASEVPLDGVQMRVTFSYLDVLTGGSPREPLDGLVADAVASPLDSEWLPMAVQLSELAVLAGDASHATAVRNALEPHASVWAVEGIGAAVRGPTHRFLARLAARLDDRAAAAAHLAAARAAAVAAGAHRLVRLLDPAHERLAGPPAPAPPPASHRFAPAGDVWSITFGGVTSNLRDSKGLRYLARLLGRPGREIAALDLVDPGPTVVQPGLGEEIDAAAREAYGRRLAELEVEIDAAEADGDVERAAQLGIERAFLADEVAAAYGLRGPRRTRGSSAERARTAVRSRIRDALQRIEEVNPALHRHLANSVRTGTFCVYDPEHPVPWQL